MIKRFFIALIICLMGLDSLAADYTICSSGCSAVTGDALCDATNLAPGDTIEYQADAPGGSATFVENFAAGTDDAGDSGGDIIIRGRDGDSITIQPLTGTAMLVRDYTQVSNLTITSPNQIALQLVGNNIDIDGNTIRGYTRGVEIQNAAARNNYNITNNTIRGETLQGFFFEYNDAAARDLTDVYVDGNTFEACGSHAIRLKYTADDAGSALKRITITDNIFEGPSTNDNIVLQTAATDYPNEDIVITGNTSIQGAAGFAGIYGFGSSTSNYGKNLISNNNIAGTTGATGGINIFYNQYLEVSINTIDGLTTASIDGNGILVDHGNDEIRIWRNKVLNASGNSAVNSGCAVMVLDSTNVSIVDNIGDSNYMGMFFSGDGVHTEITAYHNIFTNTGLHGQYFDDALDDGNDVTSRNNVFIASSGNAGTGCYREIGADVQTADHNIYYGFGSDYFTQSAGEGDSLINPQLDSDYYPTVDQAGIFVAGVYHYYDKSAIFNGDAQIGALPYVPNRTAAIILR
jgi:hypothetical protein